MSIFRLFLKFNWTVDLFFFSTISFSLGLFYNMYRVARVTINYWFDNALAEKRQSIFFNLEKNPLNKGI